MRSSKSTPRNADHTATLLGILLLIMILLAFYAFYNVSRDQQNIDQYLIRATEQQVLGQKIAKFALQAARGDEDSFAVLKNSNDRFALLLDEQKKGNAAFDLPPAPAEILPALHNTEDDWMALRNEVDKILDSKDPVLSIDGYISGINELTPQLQEKSAEVARLLIEADAPQQLVFVASRQLMLAQRIENNVGRVLTGGADTAGAIDQFTQDSELFGRVIQGMLNGDEQLNITRINDQYCRDQLREVAETFKTVDSNATSIIQTTPIVLPALEAVSELIPLSDRLDESAAGLIAAYAELQPGLKVAGLGGQMLVNVLVGIAILLLVLFGWVLINNARRRGQLATQQNKRNQTAIRRLLDEMDKLADGDLTVETSVTEDITGAIADSVNNAVDEMRGLVATISDTSVQISASTSETQSTALRLSDAAEHQREQITNASTVVSSMSETMGDMAQNANHSVSVARDSLDMAHQGGASVQRTIEGMDRIRDRIQETSKRIKRLGESSQEIGNIVSLIEDIADQTNILALNAAMQAAMAGEAGRGFAVVADEVQRLAERSSQATKQIESLVKMIQTDTNEAIVSMEASTTEVVGGAELAEAAGKNLQKLEVISKQIADEIEGIADSAQQQSTEARSINDTMKVIEQITHQTTEGADQTTQSIDALAQVSQELRDTVARFKLPRSKQRPGAVLTN